MILQRCGTILWAFVLTLLPVFIVKAAAPFIAPIDAVTISEEATASVTFRVQDADTPLHELKLDAYSSDQSVISDSGILLAGIGAQRAMILSPKKPGRTEITLTVSDGLSSMRRAFGVTVAPRATSTPVMLLSAVVNEKPAPSIRLIFPTDPRASQYEVYRKSASATNWGNLLASLPANAAGFTDTNVTMGSAYEYRVVKNRSYPAYLFSGVRAAVTEDRGTVLLIVDQTYASDLKAELARLESDLVGDGWKVIRHDVARRDNPAHVKEIIKADYGAAPSEVKSAFLFGHVPIAYSGWYACDGHHERAFPADVFYADLDGIWTDELTGAIQPARHQTRNYSGDGVYDQTTIPSLVELQVGRVDLFNMPAFLPKTEKDLLRQYLEKDHRFRHALLKLERRGLTDGWVTSLPNQSTMFGPSKVFRRPFLPSLNAESYLWASRAQYGSYQNFNDGGGSTADFAAGDPKAGFIEMAGSYFGEWDIWDDFLRAPLCVASSILCVSYSMPSWQYHHMALGETTGYAAKTTQNNRFQSGGLYSMGDMNEGKVHIALMGDPTLRLHPVAPVTEVTSVAQDHRVQLQWKEPDDVIEGYHVYRSANARGPFVRRTNVLIKDAAFAEDNVSIGTWVYMVRALKLEVSASGTYENLSQGIVREVAVGTSNAQAITVSPPRQMASSNDPVAISIAEPSPAQTVWGNVIVRASVSNTAAVERMEFRVDGQLIGTVKTPPYDFLWKTFNVATGKPTASDSLHQFKLTANCYSGRRIDESLLVRVDSALAQPKILQNSPTNLIAQAGTVVELTYQWAGGPAMRQWMVFTHFDLNGKGTGGDSHWPPIPTHYWGPGSYSYPVRMRIPRSFLPGTYQIMTGLWADKDRLRLTPGPGVIEDGSGNPFRYQTGTLTIPPDTTPPTIIGVSLKPRQKVVGTAAFGFSASDNVAVDHAEFLVDGNKVAVINVTSNLMSMGASSALLDNLSYSGRYSWDTLTFSNGLHRATLKVFDPNGNSAERSVEVQVSNLMIFRVEPSEFSATAGQTIKVTYHWAGGPAPVPVQINTQLISEATKRAVVRTNHMPSPSVENWTGDEFRYSQNLALPKDISPGRYTFVIRLLPGGQLLDNVRVMAGPGVTKTGEGVSTRYAIGNLTITP